MPFAPGYSRTKTFAALGTLLPGDLNSIQDDLGGQIANMAPAGLVTSLPGSPVDGQIVRYQNSAMATQGVVWTFRYNAGSASGNKWEFVGGPPLSDHIETNQNTTSTTYTDLGTVGPQLTVPLAGEYEVNFGAFMANSGAAYAMMTPKFGGSATNDVDAIQQWGDTGNNTSDLYRALRPPSVAITAGMLIKCQYRSAAGGTSTFSRRHLTLLPVRVA